MTITKEAVEAELAKQQQTKEIIPAKVEAPTPTPEKPIVTPEEPKKDATPAPGDGKDDFEPIVPDKKFSPVSYERFKDVNDKYKKLKDQVAEYEKSKQPNDPDNEEDREMKANFKKLWFITADEQARTKFQIQEEQIKQEEQINLDKQVRKLEREFDGTDWLPKFAREEVIKRGIENQVYDPHSAYLVMNLNQIINHFVKKAVTDARKQPTFARSNEVKEPAMLPKEDIKKLKGQWLTDYLTNAVQAMMG